MLDDDRRLAQLIQSQQTEIEMLTQQLAQLKYGRLRSRRTN